MDPANNSTPTVSNLSTGSSHSSGSSSSNSPVVGTATKVDSVASFSNADSDDPLFSANLQQPTNDPTRDKTDATGLSILVTDYTEDRNDLIIDDPSSVDEDENANRLPSSPSFSSSSSSPFSTTIYDIQQLANQKADDTDNFSTQKCLHKILKEITNKGLRTDSITSEIKKGNNDQFIAGVFKNPNDPSKSYFKIDATYTITIKDTQDETFEDKVTISRTIYTNISTNETLENRDRLLTKLGISYTKLVIDFVKSKNGLESSIEKHTETKDEKKGLMNTHGFQFDFSEKKGKISSYAISSTVSGALNQTQLPIIHFKKPIDFDEIDHLENPTERLIVRGKNEEEESNADRETINLERSSGFTVDFSEAYENEDIKTTNSEYFNQVIALKREIEHKKAIIAQSIEKTEQSKMGFFSKLKNKKTSSKSKIKDLLIKNKQLIEDAKIQKEIPLKEDLDFQTLPISDEMKNFLESDQLMRSTVIPAIFGENAREEQQKFERSIRQGIISDQQLEFLKTKLESISVIGAEGKNNIKELLTNYSSSKNQLISLHKNFNEFKKPLREINHIEEEIHSIKVMAQKKLDHNEDLSDQEKDELSKIIEITKEDLI